MKIFFSFISLLFVTSATAYDAVVIVLEAPLLKEPKFNSVVLETLRKGARVYVPTEIAELSEIPDFIQTYDRVGDVAYIPKRYIKIITNNLSENNMPISIGSHDPTDYRIEEPIPKTYPFSDTGFLRASITLSTGNNIKAPFDYNSQLANQSFSSESGARLIVTRKISFDNYDRYYFGFLSAITTCNNSISFQNNSLATENRSIIRVGPVITYDAFKNANYRLTMGTGFTYNYHKSALKIIATDGASEERLFNGFSISPFASSLFQVVDVFPKTDLIGGVDLNLFLPHSQKTADEATITELWGENSPSQINAGFKPQVSFYLGFQVKY